MDPFSTTQQPKITPAQLSFLAIYNPSLGTTEKTFQDQIIYYFSHEVHARKKQGNQDLDADKKLQEEENEKQRQIGLAQGMVNFARHDHRYRYVVQCMIT